MAIFNQVVAGGGTTPTGTKQITSNGTHDVAAYEYADVQVPTTAPAHYIEKAVDANGKLVNSSQIMDFTGVTDIGNNVLYALYRNNNEIIGTVDMSDLTTISGNYACQYMFQGSAITGIDLSSLTTINALDACDQMFSGCTYLTSIDLSSLTTVSGGYACRYMFSSCTSLTNLDLSSLTTISGGDACVNMFQNCTGLTTADLSALTTANGNYACQYMFAGCTSLATVNISALTTVSGNYACQYMFDGCINLTSINLSSLTTISGGDACVNMFQNCTGLTTADLSALTTISNENCCNSMFKGCTSLVTFDLSSLTTVSGSSGCVNMFRGCTGLTSADLSALTTVSGLYACNNMFDGCTGLTSVDLSSLTTISGSGACNSMFSGCTNLTSIYLPQIKSPDTITRLQPTTFMFGNSGLQICDMRNLESVGDYGILDNMFNLSYYINTINLNALTHIGKEGARAFLYLSPSSSTLTDLYFPMLTTFGSNPFYTNAFTGRNGLTIHFRKDAQATVEALANYATLWGAGTGSSVVFDLAGTLTGADSNSYTRSEIDSVYASETAGAAKIATAWKYNNVVYYTSGGSEPVVSDAIYSDAACTVAVTTVSAIA